MSVSRDGEGFSTEPPTVLSLTSDAPPVVGNALADAAPLLNFDAPSGVAVRFQFLVLWVSSAVTVGARFTINGPASSYLGYIIRMNTTATTLTQFYGTTYNQAFVPGTAADPVSNLAIVEGLVVPSATGILSLRSAAEIASPASVTVKAGSSVICW